MDAETIRKLPPETEGILVLIEIAAQLADANMQMAELVRQLEVSNSIAERYYSRG